MRKFMKGNLSTTVEDNDRRIPAYIAGGWEEEEVPPAPMDAADELLKKAIDDANENGQEDTPAPMDAASGEAKSKPKESTKKTTAPNKKVNDAIAANATAAAESGVVDDGLFKEEAK